ncbi:hypothetical protein [Halostagnicola sp. A-GB9-2]|uniref:hypothetical protein n=1 Tax=Halostagnicola sp. A-GB9-2 TaxID=3048066 RepID=UPI0024BFE273|nr:hypothetical protein [Halostagnicola sp. A-GB9-2]MDJ1434826.1 hypothetical protein [Halostagnicola sp. A-GB9-2]
MNRPRTNRWKTRLAAFVTIAIVSMASVAMIVAVIVSAVIATAIQYARAKLRTRSSRSEREPPAGFEER